MKESVNRYYYLVALLLEEETRGYVSIGGIPESVGTLYEKYKFFRRKRRKALSFKAYPSEVFIKLMRGLLTAREAFHILSRWFGYQFSLDIEVDYSYIFQNIAIELFADSNPENDKELNKQGEPLGLMAERLTMCLFLNVEGSEDVPAGYLGVDP